MKHLRILLDIETQRDFFRPSGSCYTEQAPGVAENIYRLFDWARNNRVPIISTVLRVRSSEARRVGKVPYCVEGTKGEHKLPGTILRGRINLGLLNTTDLPISLLNRYPQVIFEKRITDIFAHARLERLITELPPSVFIICGAGIAKGIVQAAIGLRKRRFGVILVTDAVLDLRDKRAEMAYRRMESKGVIFAPTAEIITPKAVVRVKAFRTATAARK